MYKIRADRKKESTEDRENLRCTKTRTEEQKTGKTTEECGEYLKKGTSKQNK